MKVVQNPHKDQGMHKKSPQQQIFSSSYPPVVSPSKVLLIFLLLVKWCGDHHELTVDFHGDGKEELSMKKNGPGKFVRQLF
jgi:hypothetical protein